jgi:hypothetical protein
VAVAVPEETPQDFLEDQAEAGWLASSLCMRAALESPDKASRVVGGYPTRVVILEVRVAVAQEAQALAQPVQEETAV